jgi:hypothetical protein
MSTITPSYWSVNTRSQIIFASFNTLALCYVKATLFLVHSHLRGSSLRFNEVRSIKLSICVSASVNPALKVAENNELLSMVDIFEVLLGDYY